MNHPFPAIFLFLFSSTLFAQTGPAGVGTSSDNVLWLKADAGTATTNGTPVSFWNDQSGNGINVAQTVAARQPIFRTNILNGFPAIEFDNNSSSGQNDFLMAPDNSLLDNTNGYTFFFVTQMNHLNNDAKCVLSKRTAINTSEAFMFFFYSGNHFYTDLDGLGDRFSTPAPGFAINSPYLINVNYDGTQAAANRATVYSAEQLRVTAYESSNIIPDMASPLVVGATHTGDNRPFSGFISEILQFRRTLNQAERIIVSNHLSAKYNIPLSTNDYYAGDLPSNGNYDRDVAGLGRSATGMNSYFAASACAGLSLSMNSGLDPGDYILAGHASAANDQIVTDVGGMTGTANSRWQRAWYLDVTNGGAAMNVTVEFDMSDGGFPALPTGAASNYVLLFRSGQTGNWTELAIANATPGDKVLFNAVNLTQDGYYTVGSKNMYVSPLPVDLVSFGADCKNGRTSVDWTTASEVNSDYFQLKGSTDGMEYAVIKTVKAAGNSNTERHYSVDGISGYEYFILVQVDLDGKMYEYGPVESNCVHSSANPTLFPNPADQSFSISGLDAGREYMIRIFSPSGKMILEQHSSGNAINFNLAEFSAGSYFVQIVGLNEGSTYMRKLILK